MPAPNEPKRVSLQPKQRNLLDLIAAIGLTVATWIGYGGSRGGGKSAAIRYTMLQRRLEHPNTAGIIIRRVYDDVKKNHIDPFFREFPHLFEYYHSGDKELKLPNGSVIKFGYAETTAEVDRKFWGVEYMDVFVDQAEQFTEYELTVIKTCNRWPATPPGQCKMALFFNPGGTGTEFLRRIFHLKQYKTGERPSDYAFIQAYGWDNFEWFRGQIDISPEDFYALDSDERFELFIHHTSEGMKMNALPASLRAGHLLGSFDSFAGQYYAGVWDESKVILPPGVVDEMVKPWWTRWMATDWGFAHHSCHLWAATGKLSPQDFTRYLGGTSDREIDVVVVYRDLVVNETPEPDLAMEIVHRTLDVEVKAITRHFLSPDAFAKKGSANTSAEQMEGVLTRHKLPRPEPADNDRINGWRELYNGFRQTTALVGSHVDAERARQGPLLLISANCSEVIAAVPILVRNPKKLEDVLKTETIADDVGDCLRYLYKSMMAPGKRPEILVKQEVFEEAGPSMTAKAMAMRLYDAKRKASLWVRNRRVR